MDVKVVRWMCRNVIMDKRLLPNNGKFTIGSINLLLTNLSPCFNGTLDRFRVYSSALSGDRAHGAERSRYSDSIFALKGE